VIGEERIEIPARLKYRTAPPAAGTANENLSAADVPTLGQRWRRAYPIAAVGSLVWAGLGDHLDVLGHYRDERAPSTIPRDHHHRDWLTSGSDFSHAEFTALMDAIVTGMLGTTPWR